MELNVGQCMFSVPAISTYGDLEDMPENNKHYDLNLRDSKIKGKTTNQVIQRVFKAKGTLYGTIADLICGLYEITY